MAEQRKRKMTTEIFKITSYEAKASRELKSTTQGMSVKFPACVLCRGKNFLVIVYQFNQSSPVADNIFLPQHKCGTIFVSRSRYDWLLAQLENGDSVYCYLNSKTPHKNCFSVARNLPDNRQTPRKGSEKTGSDSQNYGARTFSKSGRYRKQGSQIITPQNKTIKRYSGGYNETFNGGFSFNSRTVSPYSHAQWCC